MFERTGMWWLAAVAVLCVSADVAADPVKVKITGACPAAELAERTERELRLEGFEPTQEEDALAELHIRHTCGGGYNIQIRDKKTGKVLHESMKDAPIEEVALHAVELLRAVTAEMSEPEAEDCEVATTMELGEPAAAQPKQTQAELPDMSGLEAWENHPPRTTPHPACRETCRETGKCQRIDRTCIARDDSDCFWSAQCRDEGRCRAVAGMCMATQDRDCQRSRACRDNDRCTANPEELRCEDERVRRNRGLLALGITGVSLSGASMLAGVGYTAATSRLWDNPNSTTTAPPAILLFAAGGVGMALSLTSLIYGAQKVQRENGVPDVAISPTGGSLTWSF